ncbi:MAG: hypothetical protein J3Q66DRAFT_373979 [Benniella sp.]|nr:MAG: hypothetical protein J3Q66DRAFT_373979 [Benniella sp.]
MSTRFFEDDLWSHTSGWCHPQPSRGLSRVSSCSSFVSSIDEPSLSPQSYANLWEIQLELGEIPGMISNNLLEPCRPSVAWPTATRVPSISMTERQSYDHYEQEASVIEQDVADEEFSSKAESPECFWPRTAFFDLTDSSKGTRGYYDTEYGDEEEELDYERTLQDLSVVHPIYGKMGSSLEVQEGEYRHDRKDSGVFMAEDDQNQCVDESIDVPEQGLELSSTRANDTRRGTNVHSAAYTSLRRIASTFLRKKESHIHEPILETVSPHPSPLRSHIRLFRNIKQLPITTPFHHPSRNTPLPTPIESPDPCGIVLTLQPCQGLLKEPWHSKDARHSRYMLYEYYDVVRCGEPNLDWTDNVFLSAPSSERCNRYYRPWSSALWPLVCPLNCYN